MTSLGNTVQQEKPSDIYPSDVDKYFLLRDIEGICRDWRENSKRWIKTYLDYVSWTVDEDKTLLYCKKIKDSSSVTYYRKQIYQIRRFLEYLKIGWASTIKLPPEPEYLPKRVSSDAIDKILDGFKDHKYVKQIKALILLGHSHLFPIFKQSSVKIKDLRKFFSQEWDRRGGPTSIKKILMGHSLKGDVDLMHYNCQSEEDLKKIYDKIMCSKFENILHLL